MVMEVVSVRYAGDSIGAVTFNTETGQGAFQFEPAFLRKGLDMAPLMMPIEQAQQGRIFQFGHLNWETFKGLPGMIADALPDDFGNAVLNAWIARQGGKPADISPLQRLQYTGQRGMGALSFSPSKRQKGLAASQDVALNELVRMAQEVVDQRGGFEASLAQDHSEDADAMRQLLQVGMSAGGARPKAVLAFNQDLTQARSGQVDAPEGFTHYLMKFDGVSEHSAQSETFGDPLGYGAMEYVYYRMATEAGVEMSACHLLAEGNRRHFLTQRFDRDGNHKKHVQTLNGIAHVDYKKPGSYSYYELFGIARALKLPRHDAEQLLHRMVFNIVARNHDDHAKNFSFLMEDSGRWRLAPAYDLAYSYKPGSPWVNSHWMSLNNKRDDFNRDDILTIQETVPSFSARYINEVIDRVVESVSRWPTLAREWEVPERLRREVAGNLRLL
ncbi:type II toxin-antitoxin system HipA family toxin [Pokkaliibacter sp. CJK22405]|uniref:type II toxin-antitoxin system HipA family toxin n=1 Tax=Pokkaliibacter sp. CJK22405 TaxID=3384615 RepID=UPI0039853319